MKLAKLLAFVQINITLFMGKVAFLGIFSTLKFAFSGERERAKIVRFDGHELGGTLG